MIIQVPKVFISVDIDVERKKAENFESTIELVISWSDQSTKILPQIPFRIYLKWFWNAKGVGVLFFNF